MAEQQEQQQEHPMRISETTTTTTTTTVAAAATVAVFRHPPSNSRVQIDNGSDDYDDDYDTPGTTTTDDYNINIQHPPILQSTTDDTADSTIVTSVSIDEDTILHERYHGTYDNVRPVSLSSGDAILEHDGTAATTTSLHRSSFLRPPVLLNDDNNEQEEEEEEEDGYKFRNNQKQKTVSTPTAITRRPTHLTSKTKMESSSTKMVSQHPSLSTSNPPTTKVPTDYTVADHYWEAVLYIGACAILGEVLRAYAERLFGKDCELRNEDDWLTYISDHVCITNGGRTEQTGGALFYDLPSNILGCFFMGMITPPVRYNYHLQADDDEDENDEGTAAYHYRRRTTTQIPWLHRDHPLQVDDVFHTSLATGFCGALTTFASWNTQMVVMLDGSYTDLGGGNQVATVLFGYFIGLLSCMASFEFGRHYIATWMYDQVHKFRHHRSKDALDMEGNGQGAMMNVNDVSNNSDLHIDRGDDKYQQNDTSIMIRGDDDDEDDNDDDEEEKANPSGSSKHVHKLPLLVIPLALLIAFAVATGRDWYDSTGFYRNMTLAWLFAPVGGWLRWRLADLNNSANIIRQRHRSLWWIPHWIPLGTALANLIAAIIGAMVAGISDRYGIDDSEPWLYALIFAINTGLAGSLSTVSTMIKETVILLEEQHHAGTARPYLYAIGTCLVGMIIGLCVYSTTVRVGAGG